MPFRIRKDAPSPSALPQRIAFDNFEIDLPSGEVRKNGARIRLQAQPFQLLVLLLENAGEVVTREEICRQLWPADTFVDFEHSLAAAVNKIRDALGDAADNPRYIETLPKTRLPLHWQDQARTSRGHASSWGAGLGRASGRSHAQG
jgi:DNA-binding response OmpR family regulator